MQLALGETTHRGAGVAEQQAPGAVAVEQFADQPTAGVDIAIGGCRQQRFALGTEELVDGLVRALGQPALVEQFLHGFGDRLVAGAFGAEGFQIMEAIGIEQAQAGEVAFLAQLLRGGGQQQHARNDFGELLDQPVLGAGVFRVPDQVVRLVHHQQVPTGGEGGILGALVVLQPFQRDQGQLGVFEGVAGIALDEAFVVEQRDFQVEATAHLHQPLMLEVFRHQDEYTLGAAGEQLTMDHQTGFDGLAQAHFVGQQYPRRDAIGDFTGDVQLVRDGLCTCAAQAP